MEHIPTQESYVQKVVRIAKELDISIDEAAVTCDAFELAFSDPGSRSAIFKMIEQLDESAAKRGEPLGLIVTYAVELGIDGIWVGRYADEIPPGEVVELTPTNRARILLRIKENFPTQEVLGPMIVNRPGRHFDTFDPDLEIPEDISHPGPARQPICLGPVRLKLNERFPLLSAAASSSSQPGALQAGNLAFQSKALKPILHLSPWAALPAGMPVFQSGLSPPAVVGEYGHSERKMSPGPWH